MNVFKAVQNVAMILLALSYAPAGFAATFLLEATALTVGPEAGSNTVSLVVSPSGSAWTASAVDAWLHVDAGSASGTAGAVVLFTYDANTGATRTGTINVAGQVLTVTQAGVGYVATSAVTTIAAIGRPRAVASDSKGNIFIADINSNTIQKWDSVTQQLTTVIGSGLSNPIGIALDKSGNIYIADFSDKSIKKWTTATSQLLTVIGGLSGPQGITVDDDDNIYFTNIGDKVINRWSATTQQITTVVSGLNNATGIVVDHSGNLFILEFVPSRLSVWTAATQQLSVLVPSGLGDPLGLARDGSGNIYIANQNNSIIQKWTAATQVVSTVVGAGLRAPFGIAVDSMGNVFIGDSDNALLKKLTNAFVNPVSVNVGGISGIDTLPPVLPTSTPLNGVFKPTSDQPWLTIGAISNGVINYAHEATSLTTSRTAHINVLGQSITVNQVGKLVFSPLTLPDVKVGGNYNQTLTCTSGTAPFSFSISTGGLPPGVTLSSAGVLAGIPSVVGNYTFEIKASDASTPIGPFTGTQTYNIRVAIATSVTSSPTATPNPVAVQQPVTLSVSASNSNNNPLTYTWDFGDGTQGSGASVSHNYASVGTVHAVVTISDGFAPVTGSVDVTVVPAVAVIGTGPDSDGDGYSDSFEILASKDPLSSASSPAGVISSPANLGTLTLKSAHIKLNFAKPDSDRIFLSGSLSVPGGFAPAGSSVLVEVGGVSKRLILGETGSVQVGSDSFKVKLGKKGGVVKANPTASFTAAFNDGKFAETLAATSQLTNSTFKKVDRKVTVSVIFNGTALSDQPALKYTATLNRSGEAK